MIVFDEERCRDWLMDEFNIDDFKVVIGYEVNGKINIVVGYNFYMENSICIHIYYKSGFVSPAFIAYMHNYPFLQLGCNYVVAMMNSSNYKILRIAKKLGYETKTKVDGIFKNGDLIIATLKKDEWQKAA